MSTVTDPGPGVPSDPFPQYDTEEEVEAHVGAGGGSVAAHEAASDPHSQYDTAAEVATRVTTHESTAGTHTAAHVSFSPTGSIAATDVQAALAEVASEGAVDATALHQPGSVSAENDYGAVGDNSTANDTAFSNAITAMVAAGKNTLLVGNGTFRFSSDLVLPNVDNFTIQGRGRTMTTLSFATGKGIKTAQNTRVFYHKIGDLWVKGAAVGTGTGIDFGGVDRSVIERVRVTGFATGVKVHDVSNTLQAHHNVLYDPVITVCTTGLYITGGAGNSANDGEIYGGDISSNTTGLLIDSTNVNAWQMFGTAMESNTTAIDTTGARCYFFPGRFEGNTTDIAFRSGSNNNRIVTEFIDRTKLIDASSSTVAGSNEIDVVGFATTPSATLTKEFVHTFDAFSVSSTGSGDDGALVCEAANQAYMARVLPQRYHKIGSVDVIATAGTGNIDVAIVEAYGTPTILATSGSTAMSATGRQTLTLDATVFMFPGRQYLFVVAFNTQDAAIYGRRLNLVNDYAWAATTVDGIARSQTKTSMFPLAGKSFAGLSGSPRVPWIGARTA